MKKVSLIAGFTIVSLFSFVPAVFAVDGYASLNGGTTGGEGGATVTVTTKNELQDALNSSGPQIIQISGIVEGNFEIIGKSDKTIEGIGSNSGWDGFIKFRGCHNFIIRNCNVGNSGDDGITIQYSSTNFWVDHCTFVDCGDGELDIVHASDYITVSWCKFYYIEQSGHRNVILVGGSDDDTEDIGKLHITFHHNWWSTDCTSRMPMVRYGRVHVYNNYYNCPGNNYCVRSQIQAECLIENNYFDNVDDPYYIRDSGKIKASGNALVDCSGTIDPGIDDVFTPPYSYTLDYTLDIPIMVQLGAGADGIDFFPHWLFTLYGDFDRSGEVDIEDLSQFADYWLDINDINDINDADYYEDGIINVYDFAFFAGNWLKETPPDINAPEAPEDLWAWASDAIVNLDWESNIEFDANGYNVYRSTTSGSGYAKLNTSLVSSSDYTDDTVSNGTMYYYIVTAVDTSENESSNSVEACALPGTDGNNVVIQEYATGFIKVNGDIENVHSGYTGWGYANPDDEFGKVIEWSINIVSSGVYTFKWRYANGSGDSSDCLADLFVGASTVPNMSFPNTGAWTNWDEVSVEVSLSTGVKTIRLEAIDEDYGLANIDYLMVTGPEPEIAP